MYFDTHTHLDDERYDEDREAVISQLIKEQISPVVNIGADMPSSYKSVELAEKYDFIYAAVGVHPHEAESMTEDNIAELKKLAQHDKVVAIGEIGLDYFYDNSERELQKKWFKRQIELARELKLPFVVHNRDSHQDCMEILKEVNYNNGVIHCYSGSMEMANELLKMGYYISFAGPVTFKSNKKSKEIAKQIPLDKLLIETDSPYLTPEPHRGTRNTSAYVKCVAEEIARLRKMDVEELAKITRENGLRFFNISL